MRIAVTGASSFVGAHFALEAAKNHDVHALYFSTPLSLPNISAHRIDLSHARSIKQLQRLNVDLIVHIAAKIKVPSHSDPAQGAREHNRRLLEHLLQLNTPILYASSTAVHWNRDTPYVLSRREEEQRLREAQIPYAIIRPSAPYGAKLIAHRPKHTESFHTLVDVVRRAPMIPMIGNGQYKRQPVHVQDFAHVVLALIDMGLDGPEFDVGGATPITMRDIIRCIANKVGRQPRLIPIHKKICAFAARWHKDFEPSLIAAIDQDEIIDNGPVMQETGVVLRSFEQGVSDLLG